MSLSELLEEQRRDIERTRLDHAGTPKPILFPRDYLMRNGTRSPSLLAPPSATKPSHMMRSLSPSPTAGHEENHLNDALSLTLSILQRHKRESRPIRVEDAALLRQIAMMHGEISANGASSHTEEAKTGAGQVTPPSGALAERKGSARDHVAKLRGAVQNPQLYQEMVSTKASVKTLTHFAVECSAKNIDFEALSKLILDEIENCLLVPNAEHPRPELFVVDSVCRDLHRGTIRLVNLAMHDVVEVNSTDDLCQCGMFWVNKDSVGFLPMAVDTELFGVARLPKASIKGLSEEKIQVLNAIAGIAALSIRTAAQFERLEWQHAKNAGMLDMVKAIAAANLDEQHIVSAIMDSAQRLVDAAHCSFYFVDSHGAILPDDPEEQTSAAHTKSSPWASLITSVAASGESVAVRDVADTSCDPELRLQLERVQEATGITLRNVLITPVKDQKGTVLGVAMLSNKQPRLLGSAKVPQSFTKQDEELFQTYGSFAAISILNSRSQSQLHEEKYKADAVLGVLSYLAESDIRDVQSVCTFVMRGAKDLLGADRASLFLIDEERNELYSKVADSTGGKEIRFPIGKGIAGTVAQTGKAELIDDAYTDERFNKEVDMQLGYRTKTLLAEPISFKGNILAVAQLVNKTDGKRVLRFKKKDQETFRTFALFAGISLSNSRLLEFVIRAGEEAMALNQTNLDSSINGLRRKASISQRVSVTDTERRQILDLVLPDAVLDQVRTPSFNLFAAREAAGQQLARHMGCLAVVKIFRATGYLEKFSVDEETLVNFVIRARSKYRNVPYHNFFHAVDAVQTVYTYLFVANAREKLTDQEAFALLVAALCHDLDHMGLNNNFHLKTDSPLGILSSASGSKSVLEVHHCNLAIEILQDPTCNVFEALDKASLAVVYRDLVDCILATDMARHGELLQQFTEVLHEGYDSNRKEHRTLLMQMLLKAADISNVTKQFELSRLWAIAVTEEFYQQGDREREEGVDVAPMFDRRLGGELAKGQIGFINFVAKKFFSLITADGAVPGMMWCFTTLESNLQTWQAQLSSSPA